MYDPWLSHSLLCNSNNILAMQAGCCHCKYYPWMYDP